MKLDIHPSILNLVPYKPGKPISEVQREYGLKDVIKLASNENPLGPSPKVVEAITKAIAESSRYPDPVSFDLTKKLSLKWQVPTENIVLGNGSNELIDLLIRLSCGPDDFILIPEYAFVAYAVCAAANRVKILKSKVTADYQIDFEDLKSELKKHKSTVKIVFLPNPNNPTGIHLPQNKIQDLLETFKNEKVLFVFDEAYHEFVRATDYSSQIQNVLKYDNVAVLRTFSKAYGLAGLRLGVLVAPHWVTDLLHRTRNPFNLNNLVQSAALAALDDEEYVQKTVKLTWQGLDYYYAMLKKMGLKYTSSQGNFVLFDTGFDKPEKVSELNVSLLRQGIIMRPVGNYGLMTSLRLSVGLEFENKKAMEALAHCLNKSIS